MRNYQDLDEPGNKIVLEIGYDENGNEVAIKYACDKEKCNCVGHWVEGNEADVELWK